MLIIMMIELVSGEVKTMWWWKNHLCVHLGFIDLCATGSGIWRIDRRGEQVKDNSNIIINSLLSTAQGEFKDDKQYCVTICSKHIYTEQLWGDCCLSQMTKCCWPTPPVPLRWRWWCLLAGWAREKTSIVVWKEKAMETTSSWSAWRSSLQA